MEYNDLENMRVEKRNLWKKFLKGTTSTGPFSSAKFISLKTDIIYGSAI